MRRRAVVELLPALERLEDKQLLSAHPPLTHLSYPKPSSGTAAFQATAASRPLAGASSRATNPAGATGSVHIGPKQGAGAADHRRLPATPVSFLVYRLTNPMIHKVNLIPPFGQVLVQARQPVPGQVYNVLYVAVKNGTAQTFDASRGFTVTFPGTHGFFPILAGTQQWQPNKWIVFYVLTKKYYPLRSQISGGFELFLGGRRSTLVPGPSGIFLRLQYNPATFPRTLDWIVAFGQGAQLGHGPPFGLPHTAINLLVAARTRRIDFAGHF
jgi:hypothetical protein